MRVLITSSRAADVTLPELELILPRPLTLILLQLCVL